MKRMVTLAVVIALTLPPATLLAKERRGAQVLIMKTDGAGIKGELIGVKENLLLLLDSLSGADMSVDIRDVKEIRIVIKSRFERGLLYGFLVGGSLGAIFGYSSEGTSHARKQAAAETGFFWGCEGMIIGGIFGLAQGKYDTLQIEGTPPEELAQNLKILRSKARFPDYR